MTDAESQVLNFLLIIASLCIDTKTASPYFRFIHYQFFKKNLIIRNMHVMKSPYSCKQGQVVSLVPLNSHRVLILTVPSIYQNFSRN